MSNGSNWYCKEALLLRAVQVSGWSPPIEPSIPGFADWQELRRGGQGVVFSATQLSTRRLVAVKILMGGPIASRAQLRRFDREIDLIAGFQHPNIVRLYDRGVTDQGLPYYVMELIEGCSLEEHLGLRLPDRETCSVTAGGAPVDRTPAAAATLPPIRDTVGLLAKVCEAVAYAHQRGVVHRDLKPGNILVGRLGEPHVLDFGLGRNMLALATGASATMSQTGDFFGTLPWASPEQAEGVPERIDARSDVYSLGVILFQALTGRLPYRVSTLREAIESIRNADPPCPSSLRRGLSGELDAIVLKCLAKEPKRRYVDAAELARDLNAHLAGKPVAARPASVVRRLGRRIWRHRSVIMLGGALLVGISVAVVFMPHGWRPSAKPPQEGPALTSVFDESGRCQATELARLRPSDSAASDRFGFSVAIDGDRAVVGARGDDDLGQSSGSAYVYHLDGANWVQQQKLLASDGGPSDNFGYSVAIDGVSLVVGKSGTPENQAAYVFAFDGKRWVEQAKLMTADPQPPAGFSQSVAICGDIIVTAPYFGKPGDERLAYVFERDDAGTPNDRSDDRWNEAARLTAPGYREPSSVNRGVALTREMLVVGVPSSAESGRGAYVFRRRAGQPTEWALDARLTPENGRPGDAFGYAVAADEDRVTVAAYTDDEAGVLAGAAYVFRFNGTAWVQEGRLLPWDVRGRTCFGFALAIHGDTVIVGAPEHDYAGELSGAAYVFAYDGQSWQGRAKLVASDAGPIGMFGVSAAFDGRNAIVGADYGRSDVGAAYVFAGLSDCDANGQLDVCEIAAGQAVDGNRNGQPDRCEPFGQRLSRNTTGYADGTFLGAPDDQTGILGTGLVEYDLDPRWIADGAGPDFNVYELRTGYVAFELIDVQVSADGATFFSVKASEAPGEVIAGDGIRGPRSAYRRSYDLGAAAIPAARFIRIVGVKAKTAEGGDFDLDAVGAIHYEPADAGERPQ